jgi:hypothetical protein
LEPGNASLTAGELTLSRVVFGRGLLLALALAAEAEGVQGTVDERGGYSATSSRCSVRLREMGELPRWCFCERWTSESSPSICPSVQVVIAADMKSRSGKQCRERWHNHLDPTSESAAR